MHVARIIAAISVTALLLLSVAGSVLGQTDDDVMSATGTDEMAASTTGLAAVGLRLVDSTGSGDALIGATSPSGDVELHEATMSDDGTRTMTVVESFAVPAGGEIVLQPNGPHLMLANADEGLKPGDSIEMILELDVAGSIPVTAVLIALEGVVAEEPPVADLPTSITVEALDNFFVPNTLEAPANTDIKVTLMNYGFLPHNIAFYTDDTYTTLISDTALTPVIDPETEAIARFTTPGPGEYAILCVIHPEMTGVFIVR